VLLSLLHGLQDALLERAGGGHRLGIGNLDGHRERKGGHGLLADCLDGTSILLLFPAFFLAKNRFQFFIYENSAYVKCHLFYEKNSVCSVFSILLFIDFLIY